jgi:hypothetical protein
MFHVEHYFVKELFMKNKVVYIETEKKKIPLVFNLNVMEEIQEQYGSLEKWGAITQGDGEPKIKDLKAGIMAMMNEGIDIENEENGTNEMPLTDKQIGRIMSEVGIQEVVKKIQEITVVSTKSGENNEKNE